MLAFISDVSTQIGLIFSEFNRLGEYLDAYPVVYYIFCLFVVLEVVHVFRYIMNL